MRSRGVGEGRSEVVMHTGRVVVKCVKLFRKLTCAGGGRTFVIIEQFDKNNKLNKKE